MIVFSSSRLFALIRGSMKTFAALITFAFAARIALSAEWTNISDSVIAQVKPGTYGPTAGVVVDRTCGDIFMVVSDRGLWRSRDQGGTFERCDRQTVGGRCETGWALQADPAGKRLACFMIFSRNSIAQTFARNSPRSRACRA